MKRKVKSPVFRHAGPTRPVKSGAWRAELRHGFTMLEFAIVAPVFLLLIFAGMNYAWLMFAQMNIQQAVDDGGRYASTGQEMSGSGSRITSIITTVQNEISVPGVSVSNLS